MLEAPPSKMRPTWEVTTSVEPKANVSGSTAVACWPEGSSVVNGSVMTAVFAATADAAETREAATASATARARVFMRGDFTLLRGRGEYLGAMAVRLHRCPNEWVKLSGHPCWKVQKALDESGVEYELVKGPLRRGKRDDLERISGQRKYPVIEFDDGSVYREESKEMEATIRSGRLDEKRSAAAQ